MQEGSGVVRSQPEEENALDDRQRERDEEQEKERDKEKEGRDCSKHGEFV